MSKPPEVIYQDVIGLAPSPDCCLCNQPLPEVWAIYSLKAGVGVAHESCQAAYHLAVMFFGHQVRRTDRQHWAAVLSGEAQWC